MLKIFDERQLLHAPLRELHNGDWAPFSETPQRARDIVASLGATQTPRDFGEDPIRAVHDGDYVDFLKAAHADWRASGRTGDAIGYTFPVVGRRPLDLTRIDARIGAYSFDAATPIAEGTWETVYWSAQCALTACDQLLTEPDRKTVFALCRPPGHHAGRDYMGGYCYLNNVAIAAQHARTQHSRRVAILDVDYHHGNGTQDIFYRDKDVFFASIHADPKTDYPFYWGHEDETGDGPGKGTTLNLPLPQGTAWSSYKTALARALSAITEWGADFLVLSFGADTYADDPISHFQLQTADFQRMGADIAALKLPTLIVMEGGYAVGDLGKNVDSFLSGIEREA
ncbi:histone deacetylase family protein [Pacificimonas sp. ICDLI1SI03]